MSDITDKGHALSIDAPSGSAHRKDNSMEQVRCSHCKQTVRKELAQRYKRRVNSRGVHEYFYCTPCIRSLTLASQRRFYARHKDDPEFRRKYRASRLRPKKRYYGTPLQEAAWKEVQLAIKRGEIVRPSICEYGCISPKPIEGHHDDYSKPLALRWLCRPHHLALHHPIEPEQQQEALVELKKGGDSRDVV